MSTTADSTRPGRSRFGWEQFRFVVAALLLVSSVVKIFNMRQILTDGGLLANTTRLIIVVAFEAAAAACLIVGNRFWAWLLTLITFSIFVTLAVYAIATDQTCDCFGRQLATETIVIVDTVVLLLSAILRPRSWSMSTRSVIRQLTIAAVAGGLAAAVAGWQYKVLLADERAQILLAELLVGKPWPLNGQVDPQLAELGSGKWMILIAQQDCGHCRDLVTRYFADPKTHRHGERTAVFVFGGDSEKWRVEFDRVSLDSPGDALSGWPEGKPYVVNPALFLVEDGIVVNAAEGKATDQFLDSLLRGPKRPIP